MIVMTTAADTPLAPRLPDTLRLGPAHLTVSNLDGSIAFYERSLGLQLHGRDGAAARMGAGGEDLLVLAGEPDAEPGGRHAGLFHFALLFPTRADLARAVKRLATASTRIEGASDHGVSEAIYLRDPDDNGIELYADRPRDQWPAPRTAGQRFDVFSIALDLADVMREIDGEATALAGPGLVMGHLHLHVSDVDTALGFYRDVLGFEVMANLGSAAFVSAGGYHHHLGFNVWLGPDVKPRPPHTAGLCEWTIMLDTAEQVEAVRARVTGAGIALEERDDGFLVRDPWRTAVVFTSA